MSSPFSNSFEAMVSHIVLSACGPGKPQTYKSGTIEIPSFQTASQCLAYLRHLPQIPSADRAVFKAVRDNLILLRQRQNDNNTSPPSQLSVLVANIQKLNNIFQDDQRTRETYAPAYTVRMPGVLDATSGAGMEVDIPAVLLDMTRRALVLACSAPGNYNKGTFASTITQDTSLEAALEVLCGADNTTHQEKAVFMRARWEVKYLKTLIDAGVRYVDPFATLFIGHISWFGPLLDVFKIDCEARGLPEPSWHTYTFKEQEGIERSAAFEGADPLLVKHGN
ncbi:hypothetical protein MMC30_002221 [Trapelia coarctata]|nr:hypothetical protein [Trapelia coarctata]